MLLQGGVLIEVGAGGGGDQGAGVALGLPLFPGRLDHVPKKARSGYELLYLELRRALIGEARGPLHRGVHLSNKLFLGEKCVREPKGGAKNSMEGSPKKKKKKVFICCI